MPIDKNDMDKDNDKHLTELQKAILRAFPDTIFDGQSTPHDGEWPNDLTENAIYEGQVVYGDEKILYEGLKGQKWRDISQQFREKGDSLN